VGHCFWGEGPTVTLESPASLSTDTTEKVTIRLLAGSTVPAAPACPTRGLRLNEQFP
jgi:hypothetical protein